MTRCPTVVMCPLSPACLSRRLEEAENSLSLLRRAAQKTISAADGRAQHRRGRAVTVGRMHRKRRQGEADRQHGAAIDGIGRVDRTVMRLHDLATDREAEARAATAARASFVVSPEAVEHALVGIRWQARAAIADVDYRPVGYSSQ